MILNLYSFLLWLIQPLVRRKLRARAVREPIYGEHIEERFGVYERPISSNIHTSDELLIWIHAVSLGETRAAAILLKALRVVIPNMRLLLTNGTATGRLEGFHLLQEGDIQVWQPWDTRGATQAFFAHFKPAIGILMETEIWPNLIASAKLNGVPMVLANARLSEKSLALSHKWRWLATPSYQSLSAVYAQTLEDAKRLTEIGATVNKVFGNLKFDITLNAEQIESAANFYTKQSKPIVVFASSREGEETLFLTALKALPAAQQESRQWLMVPRHPQRFDKVASLIASAGFIVSRRGAWIENSIWLGDSLGEMTFYYGISSVALLGGSFLKFGGQNLIESLACGCPVVTGPHTFNFEEATGLAIQAGAAFSVVDMQKAIQKALQLSTFDRRIARKFVDVHRGAATKTAEAVRRLLA